MGIDHALYIFLFFVFLKSGQDNLRSFKKVAENIQMLTNDA